MKVVHWWAGVAAVAATISVAACGAGGPVASTLRPSSGAPASVASPPASATLVKQMNSVMANARSVHVTVPVESGTSGNGVDLSLTRSNEMYGKMTYKGQPITVLVRNGRAYMRLTPGALKAMGFGSSSVCVLMCGKVLKMTPSQSKSIFAGLGWSSLAPTPSSAPQLHYARTTTVDGQTAWQMSVGGGETVYVAARGMPYPLRVVKGPDRIDYTQWNSVTIPPPPPAGQVIDLSQLEHM